MSPFARKADRDGEERRAGGHGLSLDLEDRVCAACRRDVPPWQGTCPTCGAPTVARVEMPPTADPLLERLLAEQDES